MIHCYNSVCLSNLHFTANHTCDELFWTEDDNQNTEIRVHDSRKQIRNEILRNTTAEMDNQKWTNWGGRSGQTGGGARSALATTWIDFSKFWQLPGIVHMLQNPTMCVMWRGSNNFFSARSLQSKITRSGGVRSPDWHSCQSGNLTRVRPTPIMVWAWNVKYLHLYLSKLKKLLAWFWMWPHLNLVIGHLYAEEDA